MSGVIDKAKKWGLDLLYYPDNRKTARQRKCWKIAFDIGLIVIGFGIIYAMNKGNFAALASPTASTLMSLPISMGLMGAGIAWLIQDLIGKEHHRTAAKIASIALIGALAGTGIALIGTGLQHGVMATSFNNYFLVGLVIVPLSFFALANAIKIFSEKEGKFIENPGRSKPRSIEMDNLNSRGKVRRRAVGRRRGNRLHRQRKEDAIRNRDALRRQRKKD